MIDRLDTKETVKVRVPVEVLSVGRRPGGVAFKLSRERPVVLLLSQAATALD